MAEVKDFSLAPNRIEEDFGFHMLVLEQFTNITDEKLKIVLDPYKVEYGKFDISLKESGNASLYSKNVQEKDAKCSIAYSHIAGIVKLTVDHYDSELAKIAQNVDFILRRYGNPNQLPYVEKMGVLTNLIQDLENYDVPTSDRPEEISDDPKKPLTKINIRGWLDELTNEKNIFVSYFDQRNAQQATFITGASKAARLATDAAYRDMVKRLNALSNLEPDNETYTTIINNLNRLIDRQRAILASRKTKNTNKAKDNPEDKPSDAPDDI